MSRDRTTTRQALADGRSGEVVFVSHCLLNQNTRYPGGAVCPGAVLPAVTPYLSRGTGVVQMPCPEQRTWGGVTKSRLLWLVKHPRATRAAAPLLPLVRAYLRARYGHDARQVASDVEDYLAHGLRVVAVVGVAGSPTCGVHRTLDLRAAAAVVGRRSPRSVPDAAWMNRVVVEPAAEAGRGLFIDALAHEFRRRGLDVVLREEALGPPPPAVKPYSAEQGLSPPG